MFNRATIRHRFQPAAVTTISRTAEVDPSSVGRTTDDVERIWEATVGLYETGLHPAISLCVRHRGQILVKRAIGHIAGNAPNSRPDESLIQVSPDTPFCLFSASKAITAVLIHLLDDEGLLHIDDPVVEYIPEFGKHGKERITIRHLLTHRAGIARISEGEAGLDLLMDWERIVTKLCDAKPETVPGRRVAYHALTGGFVLGEIVRRVTGGNLQQLLSSRILEPLGIDGFRYGWPQDRLHEVARSAFTGTPVPWPISFLVKRALSVSIEEAAAFSNDPRFLGGMVPSGNIVSNADTASLFFQMLLNGGALNGTRVMKSRTLRRARNESSYMEPDLTLVLPVRYGLGLMLGSDKVSLFGGRSPNAFGHLGFMNTLVWADPDRDISVALLTSGKPFIDTNITAMITWVRTLTNTLAPLDT